MIILVIMVSVSIFPLLLIFIAANSNFNHLTCHLSPVSWQVPQPQKGADLSARGLCWHAGKKNAMHFFQNKNLHKDKPLYHWNTVADCMTFLLFKKKSWESNCLFLHWVCFFRRPASTLKQKGCFRFSKLSPVPLEVQHFEALLILLSETFRPAFLEAEKKNHLNYQRV